MNYKLCGLILVVAAVGCAPVKPTPDAVYARQSCCKSHDEFKFEVLSPSVEVSTQISESSPVFEFPEGKSYFVAFEIKEPGKARRVEFELKLSSSYLPVATIYYPNFMFLDRDKKVVRVVSSPPVHQKTRFWSGSYYLGEIPLNSNEHFVVLYTDSKAIGTTIPFFNSGSGTVFMAGSTPIFVAGSSNTFRIARDNVGAISLVTKSPEQQ